MIKKVISGGQTGVDQAGLLAANYVGIPTGGWAPWNWMTEKGERREALEKLGLKADRYDAKTYPIRTESNINAADGTLIITCGIESPGTKFTETVCKRNRAHCYKVIDYKSNVAVLEVVEWIKDHRIKILNVAGPRESKIGRITKEEVINFMIKVLKGANRES